MLFATIYKLLSVQLSKKKYIKIDTIHCEIKTVQIKYLKTKTPLIAVAGKALKDQAKLISVMVPLGVPRQQKKNSGLIVINIRICEKNS